MKKYLAIALLAVTTQANASDNSAIEVFGNVQAASIAAAMTCPNVQLTKDFFKQMAFEMEMTEADEKQGAELAVNRLFEILAVAKERGEEKWCASVVPSLVKPIQKGALAPISIVGGK